MQHLCRLPGADNLKPWEVVSVGKDLIAMQPRGEQPHWIPADEAYAALQALLQTAAAKRLTPTLAARLLAAATAEASSEVAALMLKELPQLRGVVGGSSQQQPPQQPQQPSFLQRLFGSSRRKQQRAELLQLQGLQQALIMNDEEAVRRLCESGGQAAAPAGCRAYTLERACYQHVGTIRAWQRQAFLLKVVPMMLQPGECTPRMLMDLLQASSASRYTKLMLQLLELYPAAAQQLIAEQVEVLLLQCIAWQSNETVHIDDDRPRVFRALWQLPAVSGLSAEAIADLSAALVAAGELPLAPDWRRLPAAQSLSAAAILLLLRLWSSIHTCFHTMLTAVWSAL
jgi:hypothetical protein